MLLSPLARVTSRSRFSPFTARTLDIHSSPLLTTTRHTTAILLIIPEEEPPYDPSIVTATPWLMFGLDHRGDILPPSGTTKTRCSFKYEKQISTSSFVTGDRREEGISLPRRHTESGCARARARDHATIHAIHPYTTYGVRPAASRSDSDSEFRGVSRWRRNNVAQSGCKHDSRRRCFRWVRHVRTRNGEIRAKF